MKNIIFHIDVNSAFFSWEAVYRMTHKGGTVDIRGIPSDVGGDMAMRHGEIRTVHQIQVFSQENG